MSSGSFGISLEDSAHIMTILRDTLYSDKILAVLREYSANAWDAQRDAGKAAEPIEVTLPTIADPTLRIKDKGPGLSQEGIFKVFAQYGASTKRNSDTAVGMLGIGSKSGFAYSDSFTVISCHEEMRRTYVAVLDSSEKGVINQLHEEPCGEETGLTIEIAIKTQDVKEFHDKAKRLFAFFEPKPVCNIPIPELIVDKINESQYGYIANVKESYDYSDGDLREDDDHRWSFKRGAWFAKMGCIAYPIKLDQLKYEGHDRLGVPQFLSNMAGVLNFNIGELQISASREELKYGDSTKEALSTKFNLLIEDFVRKTLEAADKDGISPWEKLVRCKTLAVMGVPVPARWREYVMTRAQLKDTPKTFVLTRLKSVQTAVDLSSSNRFLLKDDFRAMKGYSLTQWDYIVTRIGDPKPTWDDVKKELDDIFAKSGLTGLPTVFISTLPWTKPAVFRSSKPANEKHKLKVFKLESFYRHPRSQNWAVADSSELFPSSPFLIIENFEVWGLSNVQDDYSMVKKFSEMMGKEVPTIFGFKRTSKNPITYATPNLGTPFEKWFARFMKEAVQNPEVKKAIEISDWIVNGDLGGRFDDYSGSIQKKMETLQKKLNKENPLFTHIDACLDAKKKFHRKTNEDLTEFLPRLEGLGLFQSAATPKVREIRKRYPLVLVSGSLNYLLTSDHRDKWVDYFNLVDSTLKKEDSNGSTSVHTDQRVGDHRVEGKILHSEEGSTQLPATA